MHSGPTGFTANRQPSCSRPSQRNEMPSAENDYVPAVVSVMLLDRASMSTMYQRVARKHDMHTTAVLKTTSDIPNRDSVRNLSQNTPHNNH
jgi:hypothetical protein